ncbi:MULTISPECIES: hypothetical protein [Spirosoma]|uniref:Uncharacterized protein n=1 Tax=Spirosoma sordidisoli TaxID=2502893 RepID=A0A4Q2UTL7_9BACT|nr:MULTISPECIES: hypothetical protein [Spirosoma]RYC70179.1 hypothetical protein EQG79_09945 [Spirosoma sordidisoli]
MLSFKQFDFPPGQDFVPSKETKNFWLYTKKSKRTFSGVVLPGLFETVGYPTQMLAFFAILLLEIVPTIYGIDQGVLWQAILAAIFIDIFLAVVSHIWHDSICRYRNELVNTDEPVLKEALRRKINRCLWYTYFFYVLILISGILKFYFFYDAYMTPDAIAGAVLVCYFLGALLHVAYTGYFLYTSRFNYKIQSEYSRYVESGGVKFKDQTGKVPQPLFQDGNTFQVEPTSSGNHHIFQDENGRPFLETSGVLTDNELANLIVRQSYNVQGLVARVGLKRQMEILQTN